mmetsp:Transcript_14824/g.35880  ORF Transcript_14824/g.35880 Transcript_14824/m.35880 type:complete len:386 (+) Transcript_14824:364-1521(+)
MGTEKLANKSRADKASYHKRHGSLPLKKRRFRLNLIGDDVPDSHIMTIDSSVNDENSDVNSSLYIPKTALSCTLSQTSPSLTCFQTSDPSSPNTVVGSFPENSSTCSMGSKKHRPRLVTPLPNGCHWRTSRNKSFCRRQPCYNSSNFCKLHYQQYTNASKRPHPDGNQGETVHTPVFKTAPGNQGAPMLPNIMHQDKRFTESPGQARCLATTTRGRPCAYVAVNETKYCYLHSQYEKSRPTPRRNSYTTAMSVISASSSSSSTSSQSPLSSLPTGTWLNQSVLISTGPLRDRTGTVEKWGNGWVSVRVPEVGLHNRRSFELLLMPNPGPAQTNPSSQATQVPDSSSSDESSSQTSTNRSIVKSPVPTLIVSDKSAPQNIVSPQAA